MNYSRIAGTGSYLPSTIRTNQQLEETLDTSHEWIVERTGICSRHMADENEMSSSMGTKAAEQALEAANMQPDEVDMLIVATCTPDSFFPSVACTIQNALGIRADIPAFDVSVACAGFIYALSIAQQFIATGSIKSALVVGSEVMSRTVDWNDRNTCILFGDGAAAAVLTASEEPGIMVSKLHAQGRQKHLLSLENPIMQRERVEPVYMHMKGNEVFRLAVNAMGSVVDEILTESGVSKDQIDWLIPHQANLRIIKATAKKLAMPLEQVILTVQEHGNTSSASIPLALDRGIRDGRIRRGDTLMLEAFGGGMAWGAVLLRY